jgi:hypothetical protein
VVDDGLKVSLESGNGGRFNFSFVGKRRFKGIQGEVPVHRVRRTESS